MMRQKRKCNNRIKINFYLLATRTMNFSWTASSSGSTLINNTTKRRSNLTAPTSSLSRRTGSSMYFDMIYRENTWIEITASPHRIQLYHSRTHHKGCNCTTHWLTVSSHGIQLYHSRTHILTTWDTTVPLTTAPHGVQKHHLGFTGY